MNGLLEENDKDCDIISQPAERMDQSDDSTSRNQAAVDNSMMKEVSTFQEENSNGLSAEDMATVSMEVEESKNGEKNSSEQDCADGRRREEEEMDRLESISSRRSRRRVSSTVKPKAASQVGKYNVNQLGLCGNNSCSFVEVGTNSMPKCANFCSL